MSDVVDGYVAAAEPERQAQLRAVHDAVVAAHPGFDVAVKYQLLMYAIDGDWRHWVCAINATKRGVCLRFLFGVMMEDPLTVLRAGSANLMTWDLPADAPVDEAGVARYVGEAVARYPQFRANAKQINADAKAAAAARGRPKKPS